MESGSVVGTWAAYALIVLFLLLCLAIVLRTMFWASLLLLMPARRALRGEFRGPPAPVREGGDDPADGGRSRAE